MIRAQHKDRGEYNTYMRAYAQRPYAAAKKKAYAQSVKDRAPGYRKRSIEKNPASYILKTARHRAKRRGMAFDIGCEDIYVPQVCPILGIELRFNLGRGAGGWANSPSLDRIDNTRGYVKGNVWIISRLANTMKGAATAEHLAAFARWVVGAGYLKEAA